MAAEAWNRVNVPFPCAVSRVRVPFTASQAAAVRSLLQEKEKVVKVIRSQMLQTEVRVLYELLHILNNSFRGSQTFRALRQVEQCVNRLKNMKLDDALQDLTDTCPTRIQRQLSIKNGECDVPSQPMLEWTCLKVLGGARLMSCTLSRCSRAFLFSKQQMKWDEFVILNVVITSLLSRLWVIFRGLLVSLSRLYRHLLELLREVAHVQPMPFLADFSLPADMAEFLGPFHSLSLIKHLANISSAKDQKGKKEKTSLNVNYWVKARKIKEDLGVAIERGVDAEVKPFFTFFSNFMEGNSLTKKNPKSDKRRKFKKQVRETTSLAQMEMHLEEMIMWCKSQGMKKESHLLAFLHLKCRNLKGLEAAGYNIQGKLQTFRREACWASSPRVPVPKTLHSLVAWRRSSHLRTRFQSHKRQLLSCKVRADSKKKCQKTRRKGAHLPFGLYGGDQHSTTLEILHQTSKSDDEIDDIFASIGL
ncbi:nucleolus and neural progenitor protein [Pholidichthys leucotaenia]